MHNGDGKRVTTYLAAPAHPLGPPKVTDRGGEISMVLLRSGAGEADRPAPVRGLGGAFTPEPATGGGSFSVPLDLPPGPGGCAPALALRYTTEAPNGPFGGGFALPLPHVRAAAGHARSTAEGRLTRRGDGFLLTTRPGVRHLL